MATVELTQNTFEETIDSSDVLIVDFWAGWCAPCKRFAPTFEAASEKYADVTFGKIDTEAEQGLATSLEIQSIPTIMAFRSGYLVFRQAGMLTGPMLDTIIDQVKALDPAELKKQAEAQQAETQTAEPQNAETQNAETQAAEAS